MYIFQNVVRCSCDWHFMYLVKIPWKCHSHEAQAARGTKRLIVLGFNDTSTLEGHFVSSSREREKEIEERVEEMKERDREERGTGMKVKKQKK